ncbi:hypothetical protein Aca07nite_39160 [Actinoplanes capillaceus]|uniref:Uncharacterized protein n=1 Tax=Actinoplanes campanulatus TaxID=113559 RepID=A0ABQ3WK70_9ACTN|nr:hypothetical protein Aca07nite_39160 [Actinoplanes capillaceus]
MSHDASRTVKVDTALCGICDNPFDDRHGVDGYGGDADSAGKRVEYVVVDRRGGIAEFRETDGDSKVRRTDPTAPRNHEPLP